MDQGSALSGGIIIPPKILVCDRLDEDALKILEREGLEVHYRPEINRRELLERIGEYECIVVRSRTKVDSKLLERAKRLRVIARAGSGLDNIDTGSAEGLGIRIVRCPDAVASSVAELTLGLMIALSRKIEKASSSLRKGLWIKEESIGTELSGKILGVIGVGNVGSRVAKICSGLGMKLLLNDIRPIDLREYPDAELVGFERLLKRADFITLHIPLNRETLGLIGEDELRLMKSTAYLINTSRPEIVDAESLYRALREGWIAGAAVDATEEWVRRNPEILRLENLICTPHIGAQTIEARRRSSLRIVHEIIAIFRSNGFRRESAESAAHSAETLYNVRKL